MWHRLALVSARRVMVMDADEAHADTLETRGLAGGADAVDLDPSRGPWATRHARC